MVLFGLMGFLFSWPFFFCTEVWLAPMLARQGNPAAAAYSFVAGHMLGMLGPALAELLMWRFYFRESPPPVKWSLPKYYGWVVPAMLAFWTLPGLIGFVFGDTFVPPVAPYIWIIIAVMAALGWVTGMGEETGWCAYALPRLAPSAGRAGAMIVSGTIRGLWHWPNSDQPDDRANRRGRTGPDRAPGRGRGDRLSTFAPQCVLGSVFGWFCHRTEGIPLLGWLHYWYDLSRDVTIMLLVGYVGSLWVTLRNPFILLPLGWILLDQTLRGEGMGWKGFLGRWRASKPDRAS